MLEKLPEALGQGLRARRAGMDRIVIQSKMPSLALLEVSSPAFENNSPIPVEYTADGDGVSPPLEWKGIPAQASSLVVVVEDADAPTARPLVHLIVVNLPARDGGLREGEIQRERLESGADTGRNSFLRVAWLPPDPPPGHGQHRYVFQVFAISGTMKFGDHPGRGAVVDVLRERAIAAGQLIGTYERGEQVIELPADNAAA